MESTHLIDQLIRKSYPHPIAAAWHRVSLATSSADRTKRLLATVEVLVRVQCALLLPDYLRGPPDDAVERTLERLERPALGHWVQLLRSTIRAIHGRDAPEPFMPEALSWFLHKGRPSDASKRLDALVQLRNEEAHGRALATSEQDGRAVELLADLRIVLADVEFLSGYRPFRILKSSLSRRGGFTGRVQFLVGAAPQAEPLRASWPARLFPEGVYLARPDGEGILEISPFVQVIHDAGPREDRVFVASGIRKGKKLELKNDSSGAVETVLINTEEGDVPLDDWLAARDARTVWQENTGASEAFVAESWGSNDTDVLDGRFEVRSVLGEGGMATVFLVWDRWDEAEFALKVLHAQLAEDGLFKERFRREARTMKRLRHPNILSVEEAAELRDGRLYLKLPVVTGGTLQDRVQAGASPDAVVEGWARQTLSALAYLHGQEVIHRDIKPSNYLMDTDGNAFLADFGIALQGDTARLTRTLEQMGSLAYMSPEQRRGGDVGAPSDIYSLGVVLHELITGEEGAVSPGKGVKGDIGSLIRSMCAAIPDDRPTAQAALDRLTPVPSESPVVPAPPPPPTLGGQDGTTYHLLQAGGDREVLTLELVIQRITRAPDAAFALWQPGWPEWKAPTDVPEVLAILQPPAPAALQPEAPDPPPPSSLTPIPLEVRTFAGGSVQMADDRFAVITEALDASAPILKSVYGEVMGTTGTDPGPVDRVSWFDAVAFCITLSHRNDRTAPYRFTDLRPRKDYSIDDIGRMLREVVPFKKVPAILRHFGTEALAIMQFDPERIGEVSGISKKTAAAYGRAWDRDKYFVRDVVWDRRGDGYRLPTEAEWVHLTAGEEPGPEWVWCADPGPVFQPVPTPLEPGTFTDPCLDEGSKRLVRSAGGRQALTPDQALAGFRVVCRSTVSSDAPSV